MKLTTNTQVFVDGVMQANGGRNEKLDPGVERGGWARPLFDDEAMTFVNEVYQRAYAFLFGRRTYELFAGYWGVQFETTGRCVVRRRVRDERAASAI
jgi:dihydrofolate reductase